MKVDSRLACIGLIVIAGLANTSCRRSPEEKASRYLELGKQYLSRRDYDSALVSFRNAAREMPSRAEPHYQAGLAFLEGDNPTSAALAFRSTIELDRNHLAARLKLTELMVSSRDLRTVEEGARLVGEILAVFPENPTAISISALAQMRLGNKAAAEKQLKQAIGKHPKDAGIVLNLARSLASRKDTAGAEKVLMDGIAASPHSLQLVLALGDFYLQSKMLDKAEEQYLRAIAIQPNDGAALLALASVQSKRGKHADAEVTLTKLSRGPEKRYRTALASYFLEQGKQDMAIADLERIVRAEPSEGGPRTLLVGAYLGKQEFAKAEMILNTTLVRNNQDTDALLLRAKLHFVKREPEKAESDLAKVLGARPDSSEAHFLMAKLHRSRGSTAAARKELSEAVRLDLKSLAARLELAELLRETGIARGAVSLLDEAPQQQKQIVSLLLEKNWALLDLGRIAEMRPVLEAVRKVVDVPEAQLQKAVLQVEAREYGPAKVTLEEVLTKTPDDVRVLDWLLQAYAGLKDTEGGLQRIQKHVEQRPQAHMLKAFLGHVLLRRGDRAPARPLLEAAVAAAPDILAAQLDLSELDTLEGRVDNARARLKKLTVLDRDGSVHSRMAALEETQGDHSRAAEYYKAALGVNSANVVALNNLACLLLDRNGSPEEALKYAQRAKELAPNDAAIDDTLGWTYYQKGLYSLAARHLESSVGKAKTARRLFHLSMAYARKGDESRGRSNYEAALKMDQSLPEANMAKEVLAEVRRNRTSAK